MENCDRCKTESATLVAISRYIGTGTVTEHVCRGCCTRVELALGQRIDNDPDLLAFVLVMADAVYAIGLAEGSITLVPTNL
jgi:hypothetical protein